MGVKVQVDIGQHKVKPAKIAKDPIWMSACQLLTWAGKLTAVVRVFAITRGLLLK
jgi:hypothetical protein